MPSRLPDEGAPPQAEEFPGCRPVRIRRDELDDHDGRFEYWDARTEIAMVAEPATTYHEYGAMRLAGCVRLIAAKRGSPIDVIGAAALVVRGPEGRRERIMAADQVVYLHPARTRPRGGEIEHGVDALPDVVLEVDYSTDVRRRKLGIYESWGFPEVWVEVPDARWSYRPRSRRSALTILVMEAGRYVEAASSRAFPGWTAEAIHTALNEPEASFETVENLRRVGSALGSAAGTGADDDPFLGRELADERDRARAEGHSEGRAEARREILRAAVPRILTGRGIAVPPQLRARLDEIAESAGIDRAADVPALIELALECRGADDFIRRAGNMDRALGDPAPAGGGQTLVTDQAS